MPGPGYYDIKSTIKSDKKAVSQSIFKSDSVRDLAMIKRGPGPALYKPQFEESKKVFNFNPSKSLWVP